LFKIFHIFLLLKMFKGNKAKIHRVLFPDSSDVAHLRNVLLDIYTIFQYSNKDILDSDAVQ